MLIRVYLKPSGKPFAVMNQSRIGKLDAIQKIHTRLRVHGYPAVFVIMELEDAN
ncbi:MAG: hypothetical protein V3T23_08460 [Nitrososphaerales archaeon]